MRKPRKISVTIPQCVYELLLDQSESQGRSLSSLASYWLQVQASQAEVGAFYWTVPAPDIVNSGREEQGSISV